MFNLSPMIYHFVPLISLVGAWIMLIMASVLYPSTWVISSAAHMPIFGGDFILQAANSLIFGLVDTLSFFALDLDMDYIASLLGIPNNNVVTIVTSSIGALIAMLMAVSVEKILEKMFPNALVEGPLWLDAIGFIIGVTLVVGVYILIGGDKTHSASASASAASNEVQKAKQT
jgi:hypothetical protein